MSGGSRSGNVKPWKAETYRPSQAEVRVARAAGDHLDALHEALGRTPPPCAEDDRWTSDAPPDVRHAVQGCRPCPAREPCRSYGLAIEARTGTWGARHLGPRSTRNTETTETTEMRTA